ncbi:hypothetical protein K458DRAFT_418859 [Lentithecium fluviatile CBS 122367]|uniref:MARVEL domain-containing protein n=1 Tax=Lentithecium fluviatile CBS 122367 TaxID=1168545 RepID=A0A6G1J103_9PLEO|nr:hypothetical protein K458DRAFT_418859 [Lentithecium fluviatile CBS 122367]
MAPLERTLRTSTLFSSLFAIALLIPATVESFIVRLHSRGWWYPTGDPYIVFGFIPLFFTIISSTFYLALQLRQKGKDAAEAASSRPLLWITADFMIFAGYMIALVFEWLEGPKRLQGEPNVAFLEAYATVPLMFNMLAHFAAFFVNIRPAFHTLMAKQWAGRSECPHCHHRIDKGTVEVAQTGTGEGYSLLRGEDYDEDAGRASEERADVATVGEV